MSSFEGKHLVPMVIPLFVLTTLPDPRLPQVWASCKLLTAITLALMALIRVTWLTLKL